MHDAGVVKSLLEMMRDGHVGPQEPPPSSHRERSAAGSGTKSRDLIRYEDVPCPERCARHRRRDDVQGPWGGDR